MTPATCCRSWSKNYGGWQRGYVAPKIPVEPEQTAERRVDVEYDGQTLPLWVGLQDPRVRARGPHARRRGAARGARVR